MSGEVKNSMIGTCNIPYKSASERIVKNSIFYLTGLHVYNKVSP